MAETVEDEMLIDLVANRVGVVALHEFSDEAEFLRREDLADGVHRAVEQDRLGARGEGVGKFGARQIPGGRREAHEPRHAAEHPHDRQIGIVERLDQDNLIPGIDHGHEGGGQRLGGT
jgi:hypothetical protein